MLFLLGCLQGSQEFIVGDENNYFFSSSLSAASIPITEGEDAVIDWSNLEQDMLGTPVEPEAIDHLSIIRFPRLSQEDVLIGINNETLKQSDLSGFVDFTPENAEQTAAISDFSLQGTYVDPASELLNDQGTFLVFAEIGEDVASLLFFEPDAEAENQYIEFENDSVILDYEVDIQQSSPLQIEPAREYYIDWSELTTTGSGNPISLEQIDEVVIAGFELSVEEIEKDFLQLEHLAAELYQQDVAGETAIPLRRIDGFDGFDNSLQWIIALQCSRCLNPAPFFVGTFKN